MNGELSLREYELISAYLDGQLTPTEKVRLEERLDQDGQWRLALEELRETRTLLRSAPRYRAPRNFTISPEMARQYARKPLFPAIFSFRFSAALSALALIAAFFLQLVPAGSPALLSLQVAPAEQAAPLAEALPAEGEAMKAAEPQPAPTQAADLAPAEQPAIAAEESIAQPTQSIITWGVPGMSTPLEGRGGGGGSGGDGGIVPSEGIVGYATDASGSQMYGGGGDGGIQIPSGGGIVTYGGNILPGDSGSVPLNLPPQAVESLPEAAVEAPASGAPEIEGSGPILGLPAAEQAGQIITPEAREAVQEFRAAAPVEQDTAAADVPSQAGWPTKRIVQAALVAVALAAAAAALLLRRRA